MNYIILFIFISTLSSDFRLLPSVFCPLSSVICPLSSDICPKGSTNFDKLSKTNPITKRLKMNISKVLTKGYGNSPLAVRTKNKPNSNPNKPNSNPDPYYLKVAKMNVNKVLTRGYKNERLFRRAENKPNFKPDFVPILNYLRLILRYR